MHGQDRTRRRFHLESAATPSAVVDPGLVASELSGVEMTSADEDAARAARARYRLRGLEPLIPDGDVACRLKPGEELIAMRRAVVLGRRPSATPVAELNDDVTGDLYVTSDRLLLVGRCVLSFDLDDIEDASLVGDRILLVVRHGLGLALDAPWPRLLRVQIATARAARVGHRRQASAR